MNPIIKLIVAVLLILCLADMPYGFYTLVWLVSAAAFVFMSYNYFKEDKLGLGSSSPV